MHVHTVYQTIFLQRESSIPHNYKHVSHPHTQTSHFIHILIHTSCPGIEAIDDTSAEDEVELSS